MVFSDLFFLFAFLPVLFLLYFLIKNNAYRRAVLTVFSLLFYAWGEPVCIFLMVGLVAADYGFGLLLSRTADGKTKKLLLAAAVALNLGVLVFYKYLGFFIETWNTVTGLILRVPEVAMPIGISFFTFQTMSYVIDVYRGDAAVQRSFFRLLLYVSFFPQLIAGPIVRYKDIEEQLDDRTVTAEDFNDGLFRFSCGLCKKVLLADALDPVVTDLYGLGTPTVLAQWAGAVFFTLQLYFDFSGYSDMAIGLGQMFGFRFRENFRYPLCASSATDFWRRWHISLGSFFRDYVYIPLGGNRRMQLRNILVVWFLTGLWHGASWNFILWGLYYAFWLTLEKLFLLRALDDLPDALHAVISHAGTVLITVFGFAVFYFDTNLFSELGAFFGIGCSGVSDIRTMSILTENCYLFLVSVFAATPLVPYLCDEMSFEMELSPPMERVCKTAAVFLVFALSVVRLAGNSYSPFLYFRF